MQRIPQTPQTCFAFERAFFGHERSLPESIENAKYRSEKGKRGGKNTFGAKEPLSSG
jgi:hypothetical protein